MENGEVKFKESEVRKVLAGDTTRVGHMFVWVDSPQGHDYWREIENAPCLPADARNFLQGLLDPVEVKETDEIRITKDDVGRKVLLTFNGDEYTGEIVKFDEGCSLSVGLVFDNGTAYPDDPWWLRADGTYGNYLRILSFVDDEEEATPEPSPEPNKRGKTLKASELVAQLVELIAEHGDQPVYQRNDVEVMSVDAYNEDDMSGSGINHFYLH